MSCSSCPVATELLKLADEWSMPQSLRHNAWLRERDVADRIRTEVERVVAGSPAASLLAIPTDNFSLSSALGLIEAAGEYVRRDVLGARNDDD